jgi:4,5-DOPA dioxygenase extradiol
MTPLMPVLFVGHGSPMNALEKNAFTDGLRTLGQKLPRPKAIACVSAHWETQGTQVLYKTDPPTIHDFYGFPKPLFDMQYPAIGPLTVAQETKRLIGDASLNETWGLDHGTWAVLAHMYPHADIPTFQISLDVKKSLSEHLEVGKKLQNLRKQGVLILGSGNIVHNLGKIDWQKRDSALPWNASFDKHIAEALEVRSESILTHIFTKYPEEAQLSVPTPEHYLPLLYCFGASMPSDEISYPYQGFEYGSLSMRSVLWQGA